MKALLLSAYLLALGAALVATGYADRSGTAIAFGLVLVFLGLLEPWDRFLHWHDMRRWDRDPAFRREMRIASLRNFDGE